MSTPIITSLLDTDLYKFTMMQCVFHHYPHAEVAYRFKCRKPVNLAPYSAAIKEQITKLCHLRFSDDELAYLSSLSFFKQDFIEFLRHFTLDERHVDVIVDTNLDIKIQGPWLNTILFEVPLLAIVSETFYCAQGLLNNLDKGRENLQHKIEFLKNENYSDFRFSDFGTRRRFSKQWHEEILTEFQQQLPNQFIGTSNVLFAKQMKLKPIGTMAHEFLQAFQVLAPTLKGSQTFALHLWRKEYQDKLGIALTDVLTMDVFLEEFSPELAQQYAGLRQDSGDPIMWGEKALAFYQSLGIDPKSKIFVFSDNLTIPKAANIFNHFKGRVQIQFGIGTNLTNDVGYSPLDIVIKMTHTNHQPVVKISDSAGKTISEDNNYLTHIKQVFHL
ncbi:MAG: nicotinate phosphoribosyltransferase [Gammaproteobacteria bacterium]|jgi:nicotinate phosphoribosyltransferase|nr:nicotinate phosphoribosyltransferase [Gammaproteobacteria bacterium]